MHPVISIKVLCPAYFTAITAVMYGVLHLKGRKLTVYVPASTVVSVGSKERLYSTENGRQV
jgi:hypothetical protein